MGVCAQLVWIMCVWVVFDVRVICLSDVCLRCVLDVCGLSVVLRGGSKSFAGAIGHIFFDIFRE